MRVGAVLPEYSWPPHPPHPAAVQCGDHRRQLHRLAETAQGGGRGWERETVWGRGGLGEASRRGFESQQSQCFSYGTINSHSHRKKFGFTNNPRGGRRGLESEQLLCFLVQNNQFAFTSQMLPNNPMCGRSFAKRLQLQIFRYRTINWHSHREEIWLPKQP